VGARRDDITSSQRARIAMEVLYPHRERGTVSRLAREYELSRKTIYDIRDAAERLLVSGLEPGPHGPYPAERTIRVDRNRLARGTVVLTEEGVSQRGISGYLEELLDTRLSPSWGHRELAKLEAMAAGVNAGWQSEPGGCCLSVG
jgi:transposase-like protein